MGSEGAYRKITAMDRSDTNEFLKAALAAPDGYTIADMFERMCDRVPENRALVYVGCELFPERSLSFRELDLLSNQVARWARFVESLQIGDTVALLMENRLEYIITWLGLCKAGIKIAFINNTIKQRPLAHSIAISKAKLVVFGLETAEAVQQVFRVLVRDHGIECVSQGGIVPFARSMDANVTKQPSQRMDRNEGRKGVRFDDVFGYVYTSGTTGLPKAVNVKHMKQWGFGSGYGRVLSETDVLYSSGMPLYHSSAGGIGTGMVLHYGICQVIRRKFSASKWLDDIRKFKCTAVQYIGELCRFVIAQPPTEHDRDNELRLATGNGLSEEIWVEFQTRFGIDRIREFYGSTEGNGAFRVDVFLKNLEKGDYSGVGCCGTLKKNPQGVRFLRYDIDRDELVKDKDGKYIDCELGEPGECVFPVDPSRPGSKFVGYSDPKASQKKLIEIDGTTYVRTGDLLIHTKDHFIKFVDRIGDTFRWRGENVSTNEVARELNRCDAVQETNVYGVSVPHAEGRAGMAAVVFREGQDEKIAVKHLHGHAKANLPSYAIPMFVRIQKGATETTGTFKHKKTDLRKQGIDITTFEDPVYWLHPEKKSYEPFTAKDLAEITQKPRL